MIVTPATGGGGGGGGGGGAGGAGEEVVEEEEEEVEEAPPAVDVSITLLSWVDALLFVVLVHYHSLYTFIITSSSSTFRCSEAETTVEIIKLIYDDAISLFIK